MTVTDSTPPELSVPGTIVGEANAVESVVAIGSATATDIFPVTITNDAPPAFAIGETLVVWIATDASGNAATGSQLVRIVDTTPPALTVPVDLVAEANGVESVLPIGDAVATDIFPVTVAE